MRIFKPLSKTIDKIYSDETMEMLSTLIPRLIGSMNSLIAHTIIFIVSYLLIFIGFNQEMVFDALTNVVSLEAIYLSIFILMSANLQLKKLHDVADNVKEIQEDVDEIQDDVKEIQEDVDEIQEDVKEIQEDQEDDDDQDDKLNKILDDIKTVLKEVEALKAKRKK